MIECKFSLNLSKNGVQKTVYAKAGESNARMLIITLSHNGKVYELEGHSAMVFLESGENFLADIVDNTVQAVIPNAFPEPQVRVCELRISKGDKVIYTPMFEIVFEVSLGNIAETESLVDGVQYIIKAEHDREDSHSISMIANLRDALDSKASAETVTAYYNEFNKAFSDRDAVHDAYVNKTDRAIINLDTDVNLLKETSHSHSNKFALDLISNVNGEFYYNGKEVSGMSNLQKTQLKEAYDSKHSHIDAYGNENLYVLDCFSEGDSARPYYLDKPLAFYDEIPSEGSGVYVGSGDMPDGYNVQIDPSGEAVVIPTKTSELINDSGFITKNEIPEINVLSGEIPSYVILEAEKVIKRVLDAQGNRTFTFACITDMHYGNASYTDGIKHACQALKYIDERIKLDAVAVLGDYTDGYLTTTYDDAIADYKGVNALLDKLRFADNLRQKGNHDVYPDGIPMTNRFIQSYSDNVVWGDKANGYFYKDFEAEKLRVICVNVNETNTLDANNKPVGNISCSTAQYLWFIRSLALNDKEDASDWKILVVSHQPLDWYYTDGSYMFVKVLDDYINGRENTVNGITYSFVGLNSAKLIGNIHGHIHNLLVGYLNDGNVNTTNKPIDVVRIATPEACIDRANQYDGAWKQDVTYSKTVNTSQDTSFVVYCIDFDTDTITAVCYGAGYTRIVNYVTGEITNEEANEPILPEEPDIPDIPDEPAVTYTNLIPLSKDENGNVYVGTNGEKGYKTNTRLSSSGNESTNGATGISVTGFIDITVDDTIYFKNIAYKVGVDSLGDYIAVYKGDHSLVSAKKSNQIGINDSVFKEITTDAEGNLTSLTLKDSSLDYKYMRISALGLDANSVITKNEPIE